ncbi:hypothetical protein RHGRI_036022 [Rhododendron griersonianum]|uniref:Enoyl reductase (ER) domain-containing protein n=1 Tax=Rhododendron griersonianum TaxID=479676 RepID=A0AAV6HQG5_9ERIC|nr:hypothetical protein RHGRI_036022 [Rhododendron griersonianum]
MVLFLLKIIFLAVTTLSNIVSRIIFTTAASFVCLLIQGLKVPGEAAKGGLEQVADLIKSCAEYLAEFAFEVVSSVVSAVFDVVKEGLLGSVSATGSAIGGLMEQTRNSIDGLVKELVSEVLGGFSEMVSTIVADLWNNYKDAVGYHVEVTAPAPKKDEVLIKVEAASLNPVDWKLQKGMLRPILPSKFPFIPVSDVAGEVVEVGFGVKKFKPGDKVVAYLSLFSGGGLAEFAVAKENLTVPRPPEVSAAEAAGLPIAGLTAHQALTQSAGVKLDGSGPRKNLLITAASGGVGHYAVQLAKLGNTHVTATCGARNLDFVKGLGADEVLDYKTPDGAALKSPSGQKYDAVIHCATGTPFSAFEPNLSPTGKVIDLTPSFGSFMTFAVKKLTRSKKQLVPLFGVPKGENLDYLVQLVKEGKLKTVIDSKHPLSEAEEAWAKSIDGTRCCIKFRCLVMRSSALLCFGYSRHGVLGHQVARDVALIRFRFSISSQHGEALPPLRGLGRHCQSIRLNCELFLKGTIMARVDLSKVTDVAGEVVEVGFGVKKFKSGDKVVAYLSPFSGGGLAEFAVAKENLTVPRPPEVSAAEGAGLPVAGLTAHQALTQSAGVKLDRSGPRKNLLITAASGGVGLYAVQLAKLGNTHVTATCGARNLDFVKGLGADEVLDYKTPDGAALKSPSSQKYDAVIHCAMGIPFSAFEPNLSPNGKVIDLTPSFGSFMTSAVKKLTCSKKQLVPLFAVPKGENLDYLVQLVKEGKLKTVIDSKHPLSKAEEAWAKSIDGHATGKIIVEP